MSRDDFDLGDFGDLEEPSFPDDDSNILPPDAPSGRPPRNTTFLIVAVALVVIFLLGLVGIAWFVISNGGQQAAYNDTATAISATNNFVGTAIASTATAKSWTATPTPTDTPTFTPTETATPIPTDTPTETPTETEDVAALTAAAADAMTQTADANASATAEAGGVAVVQEPTETPTCVDCGGPVVTLTPVSAGPTPTCGPNSTTLACTGLFDDIAGGNATPGNLALFGVAALGLVGIIFGARRMRVKRE